MKEAVKALVDTRFLNPSAGRKATGQSRHQNTRVDLEQKFNLLEKSVEKTQRVLKTGRLLKDSTPVRIESFEAIQYHGD